MSVVKRVLGMVSSCLLVFAFPLGVLSEVIYYQDNSEEQESIIDFDDPVFLKLFFQ